MCQEYWTTPINRRQFLAAVGAGISGMYAIPIWAVGKIQDGRKKPNIVIIVADDLGYGELGCYGGKEIPTPHIDSLAAGGVRFTNGYVSCPVCSPTRAGLMTGRYQQRFGHEFNPGPVVAADSPFGLPKTETTLADRLKAAGYVTGMVGKWHLGPNPGYRPTERGFDEFFGFLGGAHPYLEPGKNRMILRGTEPVDEKRYLTDAVAEEAAGFIDRNANKPFFLYVSFNAVHSPLQAPDLYLNRFGKIQDTKRKTFAAMLSAMDDGVGKVLSQLRKLKMEEDTLIFFLSDNGGPTLSTTSGTGPLRGYKGQVLEGGIRVPFILQYKAKVAGGKVIDSPAIALDIHPTCVAATGTGISPDWKLDGINLWACLEQGQSLPQRDLYWRFGEACAVRRGSWKLLMTRDQSKPALFDLAQDMGEANDLADTQPDKVKELASAYEAWNATLAKPLWERGGAQQKKAAAKKAAGIKKQTKKSQN